jgi:glycine cleavage system H lipoate-binding protein
MSKMNFTKGDRGMAEKMKETKRSQVGYGSSYRRAGAGSKGATGNVAAVLGGQTWMITPDNAARVENPCIWMQAGVVAHKACNNFYDCTTCRYDQGMKMQVAKGKKISWQDAMRRRSELNRMCRHSMTGRIGQRVCAYDYQCGTCDFDQFFEDVWTLKTKTYSAESQQVRGFDVPFGHYYDNGHTWARIESGGTIRVGMDDFALKILGTADAFDMPLMGKELNHGEAGWGLRRKDNHADVISPVSGVIMEVNSVVREKPSTSNRDPYGDGWLFVVHAPDIKKTMEPLMATAESLNWMNHEVHHLEEMIESVAGPLAADGGYLTDDIYGAMPDLGWNNLTRAFLKTVN